MGADAGVDVTLGFRGFSPPATRYSLPRRVVVDENDDEDARQLIYNFRCTMDRSSSPSRARDVEDDLRQGVVDDGFVVHAVGGAVDAARRGDVRRAHANRGTGGGDERG